MAVAENGLWGRNLAVLTRRLPALAQQLVTLSSPESYQLTRADNGEPVAVVGGIPLDNRFNPSACGQSWAREQADKLRQASSDTAIVMGMAGGYHIEGLLNCWTGRVVVCEPDLSMIKLALQSRDLRSLLERIELVTDERLPSGTTEAGRVLVVSYAPSLLAEGGRLRSLARRLQARPGLAGPRLKIMVVSPMYGGSWELAGYCARALRELGHDARVLDLSPFWPAFNHIGLFGARRSIRPRLEALFTEFLAGGIMGAVDSWQPSLLLAMAQAPLTRALLEEIGRLGVVRALWFVEDFRQFDYWRELAPELDFVFTIQKGECLEQLRAVSNAALHYLPCAADPGVHRPLALQAEQRSEYGSDISFVGAGYRNRRIAFRTIADCDLKIWGSDWEGAEALQPFLQLEGARVDTETAVKVFNASKINLNLHSSTYHDGVDPLGEFVNPRTFEIAACHAFQLVDARAELPELFVPGEELVTFSTIRELRELCLYYRERPEERKEFASRARAAVLARHTYRHRMEELLGEVIAGNYEILSRSPKGERVADILPLAGHKLREFMARFDAKMPFTVDAVVSAMQEHEGPLSDEEAIFLFLHQFDELYLREYRQ